MEQSNMRSSIDQVQFHIKEKIKFLETEEKENELNKQEAQKWLNLVELVMKDQVNYTGAQFLIETEHENDKSLMRESFTENLSDIINKWFDRDYSFNFRAIEKKGKNIYVLVDEKINKSSKRKKTGKISLACGGGVGQSIAFISALILSRTLNSEILILDESFSNVGVSAMDSLIQVFPFLSDIQIIATEHYTNLLKYVDHKQITLGIEKGTTIIESQEFILAEEQDFIDEELAEILSPYEEDSQENKIIEEQTSGLNKRKSEWSMLVDNVQNTTEQTKPQEETIGNKIELPNIGEDGSLRFVDDNLNYTT